MAGKCISQPCSMDISVCQSTPFSVLCTTKYPFTFLLNKPTLLPVQLPIQISVTSNSVCSCYLLLCFVPCLMPLETAILIFPISVLTQLNSRHQYFLLFNFPLKTGRVVFGKQFIVKNHNRKFFYDCVAS